MTPKLWPKRMMYSKESVAAEIHPCLLQNYLISENLEDFKKSSRVIEEKSTCPNLEIKEITSFFTLKDQTPHPLSNQKTLKGHSNYGLFTSRKINTGTEIGEYVGELYLANDTQSLKVLLAKISPSEYMWVVEVNNLFVVIDAEKVANELALINDYRGLASKPNVKMQPVMHRGSIYFVYVAICEIQEGEELLVDYGERFWNTFQKNKISIKPISN